MSFLLRAARYAALGFVFAVFAIATSAFAANVWDGGGTTDNWNDPLNWDNDLVPAFPVPLTFSTSSRLTPNNNISNAVVQQITIDVNAGAYTIGGNSITLSGAR